MTRLRHIAIATKDPEATAAFYQKAFGLKFIKRVPQSPRGGGVFLTDGHINFAFLNFENDEQADMEGGASYVGLHHLGFQIDDDAQYEAIDTAGGRCIGTSEGSTHKFYFEKKYRGPDEVLMDVSTTGWDLEPPAPKP